MNSEEERPNRPLADDSNFLDRLADLDRGISESAVPRHEPPTAQRPAANPPSETATPARGPKRLLDLFPEEASTEPPPIELAPTPSPAETLSERKAFPFERPVARERERLRDQRVAPEPARPRQRIERRAAPRPTKPGAFEAFYGLDENPFSVAADPRFLYHSTAHDRAAQSMLDAIRTRHGIVVLTGPPGVGKTMVCRAIVEQLDKRTLTSLITDPPVSPEQLLRKVLVDFGVVSAADLAQGKLAKSSRAVLGVALRDFLYTLAPIEAFAVVIVDEAHRLSTGLFDQIRVLADTGREQQLLQVMIVGEPPVLGKLRKPELRGLNERIATRSTLDPLGADEIDPYVRHRLSVAGGKARPKFSDGALTRLFELSGGVPRVVNLLCERALAGGHHRSASTIDERLVNQAADALDLAPPRAKRSTRYTLGIAIALLVLAVAGAAAGLFVFRGQVNAAIDQWQARPALPQKPQLPLPAPYRPTPAQQLEKEAQDLM